MIHSCHATMFEKLDIVEGMSPEHIDALTEAKETEIYDLFRSRDNYENFKEKCSEK